MKTKQSMSVSIKHFQPVWLTVIISFVISCVDIFSSGPERDSLFSRFHDAALFFEKEGFEVGVWTTSQDTAESGGDSTPATVPANDWCAIEFK